MLSVMVHLKLKVTQLQTLTNAQLMSKIKDAIRKTKG